MGQIPKFLEKGHARFKKDLFIKQQELYAKLDEGQKPKIMVITCADSRVYATEIFDAKAGDLFVIRNIAGLVPPYRGRGDYRSTAAALEFAVKELKVEHIVILGHQKCGGILACADHLDETHTHVGGWVKQLSALRDAIWNTEKSKAENVTHLEQASVVQSVENLATYPFIKERMEDGTLNIKGGWVSFPDLDVTWF